MNKKLYTINTVNNFMELIFNPFGLPFENSHKDIKIYNIMDDSLLAETLANGSVNDNVRNRMLNYTQAAQASGADGILVTCTSVNQSTKYIKKFLNIPIINIEEPVAEMAVKKGKKIGVIGTIPTSPQAIGKVIKDKAQQFNKEIEIVNVVVDGAFEVLCNGDRDKHDEMVCKALYNLSNEVDVIVFAQISMSLIKHNEVKVPVLKIGTSGFEKIYQMMNEND